MSTTETWLAVPDYEGLYEVSDQGRVRSLPRRGSDGRRLPGQLLKPRDNNRGYLAVSLSRGTVKMSCVHRLVAQAFLADSYFDGAHVCHNDGTRTNNRVDNLRWGTRSENTRDSVKHGTHANSAKTHCPKGHEFTAENTQPRPRGGRNCRACRKLTNNQIQARQRQLRKTRPMPERAHGTVGGYQNWHCRCDACRAAHSQKRRSRTVAA